jgi:hypothetical protein
MLTYLSAVLSGDAAPLWPHIILLGVTVLASFAVAAGILLESPKYSEALHGLASKLVIGGVAIEAICTISLFVFDEAISSKQQSAIESQQSTILDQQRQIIRLTTPRNLSPPAVDRVAAKVCPFGAKQFEFVRVTADELLFGNQLQKIWSLCKWDSKGVQDPDTAIAAASEVVGIHFLYGSTRAEEFQDAAEAFAAALRDENIAAEAGPIPKDVPLSTNMIHIQLGRRP